MFTTRPDTLFGAIICVLSPEHPWGVHPQPRSVRPRWRSIRRLQRGSPIWSELNFPRKDGVFPGPRPLIREWGIPHLITGLRPASYGTGAIMAVPAHDT